MERPCVPAMAPEMVAASLTTVMVGVPVEVLSVRMLVVLELLLRIQLAEGVTSLNLRPPTVRGVSSLTVVVVVMLRVLKSARASVPLAILLDCQLAAVDQSPPVGFVQVPLVANAAV